MWRAAIAHACTTFRKANLEFRVGDALNLEFANNSFDVAVCSQVYEHVPDPQRMHVRDARLCLGTAEPSIGV